MDQKDQNYQQLATCLDQLIKVYRTLLDVVRREKEVLIDSNIQQLSENNRSKEAILVKIKSLENNRMKCSRDLAALLGADIDRPRLSEIASFFSGEKGEKLRNSQSVLELLVKRVSEINSDNERLVKSALDTINGAMDSIRDGFQAKNVYGQAGKMSASTSGAGSLVKREV